MWPRQLPGYGRLERAELVAPSVSMIANLANVWPVKSGIETSS